MDIENDRQVNTAWAATYLGISQAWLNQMRVTKSGPRFLKIGGRKIRYLFGDLAAYKSEREAVVFSKDRRES